MNWQLSTGYIPIIVVEDAGGPTSRDWVGFLPLLMKALAPYEEARLAVVAALKGHDSG